MTNRGGRKCASEEACDAWLNEEAGQSRFRDERLGKRFRLILERLWSCIGQSIPMAFQDWCNTSGLPVSVQSQGQRTSHPERAL